MTIEHTQHRHRVGTTREYTAVLDEVRAYIDDNIGDFSLELWNYCEMKNRTKRSTQRALSWFDSSWRKELSSRRMQAASRMLRETELTVREIARRVGYRQPAQFTKAFRAHTGVTPSDYRQSIGGQNG